MEEVSKVSPGIIHRGKFRLLVVFAGESDDSRWLAEGNAYF